MITYFEEFRRLKEFYGIREQRLERLLCEHAGLIV